MVMGDGGKGDAAAPGGGSQGFGIVGQLLALLLSEHSGIKIAENQAGVEDLEKFARQIVEKKDGGGEPPATGAI